MRTNLSIILTLFTVIPNVFAATIPIEQKNLFTLLQATHVDLTYLGVAYDGDPDHEIDGTGTFSATGWTWSTSTTYLGLPLNLLYQGFFDSGSDTGNWTGTGNYDDDSWTAAGTVMFSPDGLTANTIQTMILGDEGKLSASIGFGLTFGGSQPTTWHGTGEVDYGSGKQSVAANGSVSSDGSVDVGITAKKSFRKDKELDVSVTDHTAAGKSTVDVKAKVAVNPQPEPATFCLIAIALVVLMAGRSRLHKSLE